MLRPPLRRPTAPYRLLGILDPDREQMVAFAMKVPSSWRAKQEFYRKWEGAVGMPQITITLSAPDGRSQIVYFPSTMYLYSEGPMTSNLPAQKRSFGMPEQTSPNELAPMSPVAYLRQVFLPILAQNRMIPRELGNEQTVPQIRNEKGQTQARGYQANQEDSRQQHEATMAQIRANTEAMTRSHRQRMEAIRQFGEANTARFNERMADRDCEQRIRVDNIRGESSCFNPTTGERVRVEEGYKHVYSYQPCDHGRSSHIPSRHELRDRQKLNRIANHRIPHFLKSESMEGLYVSGSEFGNTMLTQRQG